MAAHRAKAMPITGGYVAICTCGWFGAKTNKQSAQLQANDHTFANLVEGAANQLELEPAPAPAQAPIVAAAAAPAPAPSTKRR